ncbi:hypothetical protein CW751_12130 [Brumimicrobium salinarum]|uniref:Uncharacterized protein n=1 Tax=Brumimicrobium salinarum TaxID=2058658 RepID=A0A2I0R0Q6_9FLAO|nr:hypothetical protein [Brumimicrobium salinarum]PKR79970.1 hypothetical protein CW751_12130 [Brumimicrobium salinarum]
MNRFTQIPLILFLILIASCSKTKNDICDASQICYTQKPDELYVKIALTNTPTSEPVEVKLYIGNLDDGELYDNYYSANNNEYHLMPVDERYTATAKYVKDGDTIIVIDSDKLAAISYKNCDETCYDYDDEIILNLQLEK